MLHIAGPVLKACLPRTCTRHLNLFMALLRATTLFDSCMELLSVSTHFRMDYQPSIYNCVYLYVHLFKVVPQFVFLHGAGAWLTCVPFFLDLVALASDCFVSLGNSYAKSPTFVATSFFFFILIAKVLFKECFLAGLCAV